MSFRQSNSFDHSSRHEAPVVLVVEDDVLLRAFASDLVEEAGLVPVPLRDADEALKELERRRDVSVVFTDIQMPGSIDGLELARVVADRWPPVRIVVVSGQISPGPGELPEKAAFIQKPYRPREIIAAISAAA